MKKDFKILKLQKYCRTRVTENKSHYEKRKKKKKGHDMVRVELLDKFSRQ